MYEFQKNYSGKRYGKPSVQNGEELFTEQSGYIPAQKRIENLLTAGQRLVAARHEMYDYKADHKGEYLHDPTRDRGYDMADATQAALMLHDKRRAAEYEEAKRLAAIEAAKQNAIKEHFEKKEEKPE